MYKQVVLGVQNMPNLMRKEIQGIFETKNPTKDQIRKYKKKPKKNWIKTVLNQTVYCS